MSAFRSDNCRDGFRHHAEGRIILPRVRPAVHRLPPLICVVSVYSDVPCGEFSLIEELSVVILTKREEGNLS